MTETLCASGEQQTALIDLTGGPVRLRAEVRVTPRGLFAISALVSSILLSTAAVVWTATSVARRHPLATRIKPR